MGIHASAKGVSEAGLVRRLLKQALTPEDEQTLPAV